jgi:ketoreductase RED2
VNNAGWTTVVPHQDLAALTDEIFAKTFDVNVTGTWLLTKAAMPHLMQSDDGNVINITSIAGVRPVGSSIAYSMAKAALNQMTRLLAKSCGPVRVNAVAPGLVETPWTRDWQAQHEAVKARAPAEALRHTPDDCVEAALGLLRKPLCHRPRLRGRWRPHPGDVRKPQLHQFPSKGRTCSSS